MRIVACDGYGPPDVLHFKNVERPVPKSNELRIKVHATTVTSGDCRLRSMNAPYGFGLMMRLVFGISKPRQPILGTELAGVVEAVGKDVRKFCVGDHVFAFTDTAMGCYAEFKCVSEVAAVIMKPANLDFGEAAALSFGGTTALNFLRRGNLQRGERLLVNGASGGVGTAIVQLAKHSGANVTAVCSKENLALVKSLGADTVIDYKSEDFTKNGQTYDVIVDTVGTASYSRYDASLNEGGRLLLVVADLLNMLHAPWISLTTTKTVVAGPASVCAEDLHALAALAEAGKFKPVIDRRYRFDEIVEAHRFVDTGRKAGNVVIALS